MHLAKNFRAVAVAGVAAAVALMMSTTADAQTKVKWKMQSAFGSKLSIIGEVAHRYEQIVTRMSEGTLLLKFFEPNALVPVLEGFDAVKVGSVDALWGTAGYHAGKIPALSWFTAVPFGPGAGELLAWLNYGGGDEIYNEVYAKHGLKGLHCASIAPESSGWFRKEITSLDQLKGLKMRFFGLGALVMTKLGASTQLLAAADIYPALERGVIDATEFSMPSIDYDLGFYQIAKHNYFPGWHQQSSIGELLLNMEKWNGLSDQHQAIIEIACGDSINWSFVRSEALQFKAMLKLKEKGVITHRWTDDQLKTIEAAWNEVVAEQNAKDPLFKRVYDSYTKFREGYAIWRVNGYLQ